ncbi:MAG: helix-turn-helix transcriptional regulator [Adlercreutzia sp.]|nr:helix-turn-helix transcriptional regulator [Adlercreutzia sp.]
MLRLLSLRPFCTRPFWPLSYGKHSNVQFGRKQGGILEFGKRLREIRVRTGRTQQEMAALLNVALRSYQKYEEGSRNPSFESLVNIAQTFNVTTDWLLGLSDADPFGE